MRALPSACRWYVFKQKDGSDVRLDGQPVAAVFADLTAGAVDLTTASRLSNNVGVRFIGTQQNGPFTIPGETARGWLVLPTNSNGKRNVDVVRPSVNGMDITRRVSDTWIVDFGCEMGSEDAALFEAPYTYVLANVKPMRDKVQRETRRRNWWRLGEAMPALRRALAPLPRYIATPRIAKHRLFVWLDRSVLPDCQVVVIARDDDTTFGVLHSRFHEAWALRLGTSLEDRPRYTPSTTFETFPFPEGLTPDLPASEYADDPRAVVIASAAKRLDALREAWLNPADLVRREQEVVTGFPDRILPVDDKASAILRSGP